MKLFRLCLGIASCLILATGYLASQYMYFVGKSPEYTRLVDQSPLPWLCLAVLAGLVVSAAAPQEEADAA